MLHEICETRCEWPMMVTQSTDLSQTVKHVLRQSVIVTFNTFQVCRQDTIRETLTNRLGKQRVRNWQRASVGLCQGFWPSMITTTSTQSWVSRGTSSKCQNTAKSVVELCNSGWARARDTFFSQQRYHDRSSIASNLLLGGPRKSG